MSTPAELLACCQRHRDWIVSTIEDLVRLESPSDDKAALDRCASWIQAKLDALGWQTTRLAQAHAGDHLRAEIGSGDGQILLLGHYDTVWPVGQLERMPLRREAGRLHGPGVFDMKAGLATAWLAVRALAESGVPTPVRIVMLITSDEEVGSATSRAAIEAEAANSRAVLVLEPSLPGGAVKTSRKGVGEYRIEATGIAAHAGIEPHKGASAILELARSVLAVTALQDAARGLTINVGRIEGGTRSNVVAAHAVAEVDVRVQTAADAERVAHVMASLEARTPGVTLRVTGGINRPPLERTAGVLDLFHQAREVAEALGLQLGEGATGGASDGNFTAALGVPTLDGLGPEGAGAHALDEHVLLEPLPQRAALVAGVLLRLGARLRHDQPRG
jgi:glutamate carboxypeptidase